MRSGRLSVFVLLLGLASARCGVAADELSQNSLKDLRPGEFAWVLEYAGKPATQAMDDPRFAVLRDHPLSILKAQFDLGDPAGGKTLVRDETLTALKGVPDPIETRLGRYVMLSGCRDAACTDRAFVWVDTVRGLVLAVLLTRSSSDLPGTTPEMLIASRQLAVKTLEPQQLPERFRVDWGDWAFEKRLPRVMTERVVNMFGGASVVFHDDETMCVDASTTRDALECGEQALDAAGVDLNALLAQLRGRFAAGSGDRMHLDKGQTLWQQYMKETCQGAYEVFAGGTEAPVAGEECERSLTHDRVRRLNEIYWMPLHD